MTDSTRYDALDAIVPESLADKAARLEAEQAADLEYAAAPVRDRVAARRDPRYAAVLAEIAGFGWPAGNPMVPGSWADAMATRVMAAIRAEEA